MKKALTLVMAQVLFAAFAYTASAQGITTAVISGTVKSASPLDTAKGKAKAKTEPLPGTVVLAIHQPSNTQYTVEVNESGRFTIPGMRIGGPYKITATLLGYQPKTVDNVYLELGDNYHVNFSLYEESAQLQEVVVSDNKDNIMNSDRTGAATNIRKEQFERLPSINRSLLDFTNLAPQAGGGGNGFTFGGRSQLNNNFTIDGATSGNLFGLSALPGGQSGAQPVSLDALQEIKVSMAPYDVRQGSFTGAGVNAVTRSGTNEFSGSAYSFFRSQNDVGNKVDGQTQTNTNFNYRNVGFRVGGPIIKDKLFFFGNYENELKSQPAAFYVPSAPGVTGNNVSSTSLADLNNITNFLETKYGYNPGPFQGFNVDATASNKVLFKLDYNLNPKNKFSLKYSYLIAHQDVPPSSSGGGEGSPQGGRGSANQFYIPFESSYYRINNKWHSFIAEWNSIINKQLSNNLQVGYQIFRDLRSSPSPSNFPLVDIYNPNNGKNETSFGYEPFTYQNTLNQDVFQLTDNLNLYKGDHTFTFGGNLEYVSVYNLFWPERNPIYQYNSLQQFENDANGIPGNSPNGFLYQYSAVPGSPAYKFQTMTTGFYAQDEYTGIKNLKLTAGIRVDVPTFLTKLQDNPHVDSMTFNNGLKINLASLPKTTPLFSPRIGANWDVLGDKKTQVRGGTGVFTGRIPYVYAGNQAGNNGLLLGQVSYGTQAATAAANIHFSPNPDAYLPANPSLPPTYAINYVSPNFKFPQVWRTNVAVDQKLFWDMIGTLEFIYTKDINALYYYNANQVTPTAQVSGDGRYYFPPGALQRNINQQVTQALVLTNTNQGYQWSMTAQLQKTFKNGFYASAAYTYTDSRDVASTAGNSTASTFWSSNQFVGNINQPTMSYSSSLTPNRVVANASYRHDYLKAFKFMGATTVSFSYIGQNLANVNGSIQSVYSYTVGGDPSFSTASGSSLMYIPRSEDDIILVPNGPTDTRTQAQLWQQLNAYINQDSYLSEHRGQFAARNGVVAPFYSTLNFRLLQDIFTDLGQTKSAGEPGFSYKGKRNSLQFSFEVTNLLNMLNSHWGCLKAVNTTQLLNFVGFENPAVVDSKGNTIQNPSGRAIYTFPTIADPNNPNNQIPVSSTYKDDPTINTSQFNTRYQIQLGLRYIFN